MKKLLLTLAAFAALVQPAWSQDKWPSRPIKFIVPYAAGGNTDAVTRIAASHLQKSLGVGIVIENRGGAGGIVGTDAVAKAAPDGYTLLATSNALALSPALYKKLPYDAMKGFTHISGISLIPAMMAINADVPAKTVKDFVALTKANPGKYYFSSSGNGSAPQLFGEAFKIKTGALMTHVPYKGSGPAVIDLAAGQVHMMMDGLPSLIGQIKSGKLRALAAMADKRFAIFPDVPTMAEAGYPGLEDGVWYGLSGPAGIPRPVVEQLYKTMQRVLSSPDVIERFATVEIGRAHV